MKLIEKEYCYILDGIFNMPVIAGFTKPNLKGNLPGDINTALSFLKKDLKTAYLNQLHSSQINYIEKEGLFQGDGLFTKAGNLVLVVKTADCLPVFFSSEDCETIGIVHMGWRSAKEGILNNIMVDSVRQKKGFSSFRVVAGPGLRKCCYQVGEEFLRYADIKAFLEEKKDKLYFDPAAFARGTLIKKGLKAKNFFDVGICSF